MFSFVLDRESCIAVSGWQHLVLVHLATRLLCQEENFHNNWGHSTCNKHSPLEAIQGEKFCSFTLYVFCLVMLVIIYLLLAGALVYYIWSFLQVRKLNDHNITSKWTESHTRQHNVMNISERLLKSKYILNFKVISLNLWLVSLRISVAKGLQKRWKHSRNYGNDGKDGRYRREAASIYLFNLIQLFVWNYFNMILCRETVLCVLF